MNYNQLIISLTTHFGWEVHQTNVKSVVLHGDLTKDIFMDKYLGFEKDVNLFYQLKKSLYGLKQEHRVLHEKIN
jgi:hypothetical protein